MLICFFDCRGTASRFFPTYQTANHRFNLQVLECLRQWVYCMMPELFLDKWILHHDNTTSSTVLSIIEVLAKCDQLWSWNIQLTHQICSLGLLPLFYHEELSQDITIWNHGRYSEGCNSHSKKFTGELWTCFDSWKQCCSLCIVAGGNCSEGEHCSSE